MLTPKRIKLFLGNLGVLAITVLLGVVLTESFLRLSDSAWERERALMASPKPRPQYQQRDNGLYTLMPNQQAESFGACFESGPISINEMGFRGRTPGPSAAKSIALLGDSFIEALQVPDGVAVADRLANLTGLPVLNSGVSGYATTTELLAWRSIVGAQRPSVVVLFFFLGNDVSGNSCELSQTSPPCGKIVDGNLRLVLESKSASPAMTLAGEASAEQGASLNVGGLKFFLRRHFALYGLLHDAKLLWLGFTTEQSQARWDLYADPIPAPWSNAWSITSKVLEQLKREVEQSGARFAMVAIPEHIATAPDPSRLMRYGAGSATPKGFDPNLPTQHLLAIAEKLDIPTLDLLPVFKAYRDRHALPPPYFSFNCNGHWNPLGHALAAAALAEFLAAQGYDSRLKGSLDQAMRTSPQEFLGEDGFQQVYRNGVYNAKAQRSGAPKAAAE